MRRLGRANINSVRVRKGLVAATLAAATLCLTAIGCASDLCACEYPEDEPTRSETANR